jgi:hypothetical protein
VLYWQLSGDRSSEKKAEGQGKFRRQLLSFIKKKCRDQQGKQWKSLAGLNL